MATKEDKMCSFRIFAVGNKDNINAFRERVEQNVAIGKDIIDVEITPSKRSKKFCICLMGLSEKDFSEHYAYRTDGSRDPLKTYVSLIEAADTCGVSLDAYRWCIEDFFVENTQNLPEPSVTNHFFACLQGEERGTPVEYVLAKSKEKGIIPLKTEKSEVYYDDFMNNFFISPLIEECGYPFVSPMVKKERVIF